MLVSPVHLESKLVVEISAVAERNKVDASTLASGILKRAIAELAAGGTPPSQTTGR